jgi:cytochrome c553
MLIATPAAAQDASRARLLASNCANCHGTDGHSQGGMPSLTGQAKAKLIEAMQEFRSGKRVATIMHQISKGYTDAEIELLAGYFAAQK